MNEDQSRGHGSWARHGIVAGAVSCAIVLLIHARGPSKQADAAIAGQPAEQVAEHTAPHPVTPSVDAVFGSDTQLATVDSPHALSSRDQARLAAYRATTAADALRHARRLDADDSGRRELMGLVGGICRRPELSSREARYASSIKHRSLPDTEKHRQLHSAWWDALQRYCVDITGTEVLSEMGVTPSSERTRVEAIMNAQGEVDLRDALTLDDAALLSLIVHSSQDDQAAAFADPELAGRIWSMFLDTPDPNLARQAGSLLAQNGAGVFSDTQKLLPKDWWDPRTYDINTENKLSVGPSLRETLVRNAAEQVFVCRRLAVCGARTALGLWEPALSELQLAMGLEGYWRSMLSPLEWEAVESIHRQLEAERRRQRGG
jgi:hypothetical protein